MFLVVDYLLVWSHLFICCFDAFLPFQMFLTSFVFMLLFAGEEVYIVNKEHFIIGRGTLLSAPFERVTPKTAQKEDNAGEDGFIEDKFS